MQQLFFGEYDEKKVKVRANIAWVASSVKWVMVIRANRKIEPICSRENLIKQEKELQIFLSYIFLFLLLVLYHIDIDTRI